MERPAIGLADLGGLRRGPAIRAGRAAGGHLRPSGRGLQRLHQRGHGPRRGCALRGLNGSRSCAAGTPSPCGCIVTPGPRSSIASLASRASAQPRSSPLKPRFDPSPQSHALVPATPEVLYAEVQADTVGPVIYQVRPYSSWQREVGDHPERAFTLDVPEALVCRGVSHEQIQLPAGVAASAIAAI